jgi:cyclase
MTTSWNRRTFIKSALGALLSRSIVAQARITSTALSENIFLLRGAGANVVAMIAPDGVVLVDGGLAEQAPALLQTVSTLSGGRRVHTLFNTCWFPEQTGANAIIGQTGATIIAHENTRLWMTTDIERPWENRAFPPIPKEARPNKTFYDKGTLPFANETIEYGYMLQAHTDGDIYVFFPKANILGVGGVITGEGWPTIDWWTGGWIGGLVNGIDKLLKVANEQTRIVAANGPVLTRADLQEQHRMYDVISNRLHELIRQGLSPAEALAKEPTKEFNAKMGNPEMFVRLAFQSLWGQLTPDA